MPRLRLIVPVVLLVVVVGVVAAGVAVTRVRARSQADWLIGKNVSLAPAIKGLKEPTLVAWPPDGSKRMFVLERAGRVRVADADGTLQPSPLLDISGNTSLGVEEGLLGLAFDPNYSQNGYMYIDYTANDLSVNVVRYTVAPGQDQLDPSTAATIMSIRKRSATHNGGTLAFGPDGYLYISLGDDEASQEAQSTSSIYGKILRIDVDSAQQPYAVPPSNPFADTPGARPEIWAYGYRNPWRFSFDRSTGDMWIGDVGDAKWEEVDMQPVSSRGGENYGWPYFEGAECEDQAHCSDPGLVPPLVTYGHNMTCAIMGGYVYRGSSVPAFEGKYLFGDLCTGGIFTMTGDSQQGWTRVELGYNPIKIDSFAEDPNGEVYVADMQGGVIYRIADGSMPS
jgi:glucose/arabinose dehydrogenase